MPGTKAGAAKIKALNIAKDPDFYKKMGALGGKGDRGNLAKKGFGSNPKKAKTATQAYWAKKRAKK